MTAENVIRKRNRVFEDYARRNGKPGVNRYPDSRDIKGLTPVYPRDRRALDRLKKNWKRFVLLVILAGIPIGYALNSLIRLLMVAS